MANLKSATSKNEEHVCPTVGGTNYLTTLTATYDRRLASFSLCTRQSQRMSITCGSEGGEIILPTHCMTDMSNEISSELTVDFLSLWHIIGLVSIENVPEFGKGNTCTVGTWTYVCELGESPTYPTFDMAEKGTYLGRASLSQD